MSVSVHSDQARVALVQKAWLQALDTERCDFTKSWEEAGGDSLATLHLMLRIEKAFGCKLTFDMLRPEMHVGDLVGLLRQQPVTPTDGLPLVHLVPGLFGDEPRLAILRQALAGRISFNVVALPDVSQAATILGDTSRTAAPVARAVQERQPTGPIMLAGFSFGGCVAFETARELIAAGREVAFLGLLDPPFGRVAEGTRRTLRQRLGPTTIRYAVGRWASSWDAGRRAALSLIRRFGLSAQIAAERFIYLVFREHAADRWSPSSLDVNTWLAVSAELAPRTLSIWRRLCVRLRVVQLPGAHLDIFHAPAADLLLPAFEGAIRTAHSRMRAATHSVDESLSRELEQAI